jgi:hypothetical protein
MPELKDFTNAKLQHAEIAGLARLHLYFTSLTHELIGDFSKRAGTKIITAGNKDGLLDFTSALKVQTELSVMWGGVMREWTRKFGKAREVAVRLPFGWMAEMHQRLVYGAISESASSAQHEAGKRMLEAVGVNGGVFEPQFDGLLSAASEYLYGDGLNLSQRIWQVDNEARSMIGQILINGVQSQKSAYQLAQELEVYLGANQDCPRWTSTRLYKMTKKDIAGGDLRGLVSGDACDGQGVAYNALRLARTEIQKIHALATDRVMAASPWVDKEQVNLSKGHTEEDECDQVIADGENGDGVYPVGTIELPIHPNCLCYKTSVLVPEDQFISDLAGWTKGEQAWPEMDAYASQLGVDGSQLAQKDLSQEPSLLLLAVWMFSQELSL